MMNGLRGSGESKSTELFYAPSTCRRKALGRCTSASQMSNADQTQQIEGGAGNQNRPEFQEQFKAAILASAQATERGDFAAADQAALEAFMLAAEEAAQNPTPALLLEEKAS